MQITFSSPRLLLNGFLFRHRFSFCAADAMVRLKRKHRKEMANCKQQTATPLRPFVRSLKFDRFQTLRNYMRQDVQTDATGNIQQ